MNYQRKIDIKCQEIYVLELVTFSVNTCVEVDYCFIYIIAGFWLTQQLVFDAAFILKTFMSLILFLRKLRKWEKKEKLFEKDTFSIFWYNVCA